MFPTFLSAHTFWESKSEWKKKPKWIHQDKNSGKRNSKCKNQHHHPRYVPPRFIYIYDIKRFAFIIRLPWFCEYENFFPSLTKRDHAEKSIDAISERVKLCCCLSAWKNKLPTFHPPIVTECHLKYMMMRN